MGHGKTKGAAIDREILRDAKEVKKIEERWRVIGDGAPPRRPKGKYRYVEELARLQFELLKLQEWVRVQGLRVCVLFEGRDAAGKGGVIKRIAESLNPRVCRIVALGTPTEKERTQWYSRGTWPTSLRPGRSSSSIAAGTTAPASSA